MKSDPLLGTVIDGRYKIDARLARGGMASVYRGMDMRLQRSVAIKVIHSHLAEQPDFVDRFIREARSSARLSNAHVVSVFDQGVAETAQGSLPYLVMELVEGSDLRSLLSKSGSLPLGVALEVTRQTLVALALAHKNDIVHRDVKPENILLDGDVDISSVINQPRIHARVADFGLARAASSATNTQTSTMLGTVAFVAPELVSEGRAGPSSDVYSTGIMLYELIAGALPFTGESPLSVAFKHVNEPMPRLTELAEWMPPAIDSLIALFTAKNPNKRPANGQAALDALEDVVASLPEETLIKRVPVFPSQRTEKTIVAGPTPPVNSNETQILEAQSSTTELDVLPAPDRVRELSRRERKKEAKREKQAVAKHRTKVATPSPDKKKRKGLRAFLLLLFLALVGGVAYGVHWYFNDGPGLRVEVSDVVGMDRDQAVDTLTSSGLTSDVTTEFSDTVPAGVVISTDPEAGTGIHPDTPVGVLVSDGVEHVTVPNVANLSAEEADAAITDARLNPVTAEEYSETVEEGFVIRQEPASGESVEHSTNVTYVVSLGREPIEVPDLAGMNRDEVATALEVANLNVTFTESYSDDVDAGDVISQSPSNGETLYRGDTVTVEISLGPELIPVPNVVGMQEGEAIGVLSGAGFEVEVEYVLDGYFGTVRMQIPGSGQEARPGSVITLTIV